VIALEEVAVLSMVRLWLGINFMIHHKKMVMKAEDLKIYKTTRYKIPPFGEHFIAKFRILKLIH